ncbi:hypothetical protein [Mesorhizobium sp. 1M-11]|uniref:hypothetical protein n=1 Tax=Mesorhizobium sp. 1M-11 TaxID=1529006 RepID=UPI0006C74B4B|nr:hypothetical protein [Mesorhizobium sp. 1M-11]
MKRRWLVALLTMALPVLPAPAAQSDAVFAEHVVRQLSCKSDPDPTATLLYLNKYKHIRLDAGDRIDSQTCWPLMPAHDIRGLSFTHVCASAEDPMLIDLFPKLYYRGPGTSPGTRLGFITKASTEQLKTWAAKELGNGNPYKVGNASFQENEREISCSSLSRM